MTAGGIYPALITPFDSAGRFDPGAQARLIDILIARGADGFYITGSSAEALLLTADERKAVLEAAVEAVRGRCPIIAHVGCVDEAGTLALARHAAGCGVEAVAMVPPFYYSYPFERIEACVARVAEGVGLPLYYYHIPGLTHVELNLSQMERILSIPGVAGLKNTSLDMRFVALAHAMGKAAFCGMEHMLVAALSMGAVGAVGSSFNVMVEKFAAIQARFRSGDMAAALALQEEALADLRVLDASGGIPAIKYVLEVLGLPCGAPRLPFERPGPEVRKTLEAWAARRLTPMK